MPSAKNFYDVLGVAKDASDKDIKSAFRKLAQKYHPDRGGDEAKFKEISEAYETLSNPDKRREYDTLLRFGGGIPGQGYAYSGRNAGPSMADIFDSMFRGEGVSGAYGTDSGSFGFEDMFRGARRPAKGKDVTLRIDVSFDEALKGGKRKLTYSMSSTGERESVTVPIPAGAYDESKVRIKGKGEYSPNGGERGDLLVVLRVAEHPLFKREGRSANLYIDVPISMYEAALGCTVDVPTPTGKVMRLKVPAGTQNGRTFRFKDMGAPDMKHPERVGALMAKVNVKVPTSLDDHERATLQKLLDADDRQYRSGL